MNGEALQSRIVAILRSIAPEIEEDKLRVDRPLRDQVDLDSMDWLNFLVALHEQLKVDIPESDYRKLVTLADLVTYVGAKVRL